MRAALLLALGFVSAGCASTAEPPKAPTPIRTESHRPAASPPPPATGTSRTESLGCGALAKYLSHGGSSHDDLYDPSTDRLFVYGANGREYLLAGRDSACIAHTPAISALVRDALATSGHLGDSKLVLTNPAGGSRCQAVPPSRLPDGTDAEEAQTQPHQRFVWGRGQNRVTQQVGGNPLNIPKNWEQRVAFRGTEANLVPIGDPGEIAFVFDLDGCTYTTWIGPGLSLAAATAYISSY